MLCSGTRSVCVEEIETECRTVEEQPLCTCLLLFGGGEVVGYMF